MAVPKRKKSKSRKGHRQNHQKLPVPAFSICEQCNRKTRAHHVCGHCGYYRGEKVLDINLS